MARRVSLSHRSPPPSSRRSKARRPALILLLTVALTHRPRQAGGAVLGPAELAQVSAYDTPGDGVRFFEHQTNLSSGSLTVEIEHSCLPEVTKTTAR